MMGRTVRKSNRNQGVRFDFEFVQNFKVWFGFGSTKKKNRVHHITCLKLL